MELVEAASKAGTSNNNPQVKVKVKWEWEGTLLSLVLSQPGMVNNNKCNRCKRVSINNVPSPTSLELLQGKGTILS